MKKLASLFLVALVVLSTAPTALAEGPLPPHKDPAAAASEFEPISVFAFFGGVLDLLNSAQYGGARALLETLKAANIPDELRFILDRYAELLRELSVHLEEAEVALIKAASKLELREPTAAAEFLKTATASLDQARQTFEELQAATSKVGSFLEAIPGVGPLGEAYQRFLALWERLEALMSQYNSLLAQLQQGSIPAVKALLYPVFLAFNAPVEAYPGRPIEISGAVTSQEGSAPVGAYLRLLLGGRVLDEFPASAAFQREITIPADTREGPHLLALEFPAQGQYKGARATRDIKVVRLIPAVEVRAPRLALFWPALKVSGKVASSLGPVHKAQVNITLGKATTIATTDDEGAFSTSLKLPVLGLLMGPQDLLVEVEPQEPWLAQGNSERRVFLIGFAHLGLLLLAAYILAMLIRGWRRRLEAPLPEETALASSAGKRQAPSLARTALTWAELSSSRARIVRAYHGAARFQEVQRGVSFRPFFTLRDFLRALGLWIGNAFADLTMLAERALYRSRDPEEAEVVRAEELSARVQGEK